MFPMVDPMTLAAGAIVKLAFDEFVKSSAGEAAKQSVGGAIELVKTLRNKIRAKLQDNERAQKAIQTIEQEGSQSALTKLETYLDDTMEEDETFAIEIRQIAQQIINAQNRIEGNRTYSNYGRDQINIETIKGNPKIGGS